MCASECVTAHVVRILLYITAIVIHVCDEKTIAGNQETGCTEKYPLSPTKPHHYIILHI